MPHTSSNDRHRVVQTVVRMRSGELRTLPEQRDVAALIDLRPRPFCAGAVVSISIRGLRSCTGAITEARPWFDAKETRLLLLEGVDYVIYTASGTAADGGPAVGFLAAARVLSFTALLSMPTAIAAARIVADYR